MTDAEIEILRSGRKNLAFFFRAETPSGIIRLFAGAGDYPVPADAVETEGGVYQSAGQWAGDLPDVDHVFNGQAQGMVLTMAAVDLETARSYLADRSAVVGAPAAFGWAVLDDRHRAAGPIRWPLRGVLSQPRVYRRKAGEAGWTRCIAVTLLSGAYARRRGMHSYFTGPDQRRLSPTDAGCDRAGLYTVETTRIWPN